MPVIISMLRGVNVGGHNLIKMDALRALYESLKLKDPRTYVQSGNVVFSTKEVDLVKLSRRIEDALERSFGFRPVLILRTAAAMRNVIERNPFAARTGLEPGKFYVAFLAREPDPEAREKVLAIRADPEELKMDGQELYIYYPDGMGRSKLSHTVLERALKIPIPRATGTA